MVQWIQWMSIRSNWVHELLVYRLSLAPVHDNLRSAHFRCEVICTRSSRALRLRCLKRSSEVTANHRKIPAIIRGVSSANWIRWAFYSKHFLLLFHCFPSAGKLDSNAAADFSYVLLIYQPLSSRLLPTFARDLYILGQVRSDIS